MKSPIQDEILVGAQEVGYREASRLPRSQPVLSGCPLPSLYLPTAALPSSSFYQRELAGLAGAKEELVGRVTL